MSPILRYIRWGKLQLKRLLIMESPFIMGLGNQAAETGSCETTGVLQVTHWCLRFIPVVSTRFSWKTMLIITIITVIIFLLFVVSMRLHEGRSYLLNRPKGRIGRWWGGGYRSRWGGGQRRPRPGRAWCACWMRCVENITGATSVKKLEDSRWCLVKGSSKNQAGNGLRRKGTDNHVDLFFRRITSVWTWTDSTPEYIFLVTTVEIV